MGGVPRSFFLEGFCTIGTLPRSYLGSGRSRIVLQLIGDALTGIVLGGILVGRDAEIAAPLVRVIEEESFFRILEFTPGGGLLQ